MIDQRRELFERFGRLDTWIVGLQYYDGANAAANQDVVFERDPDNPFDPNAIAVFTTTGTQVLYRMLKAHIADLEEQERQRLREQVLASVKAMDFGRVMGWPELTVIPLDADGDASQGEPTPPDAEAVTALAQARDQLPDVLRLLPSRCPYPTGARGAVVLVHGAWHSLDWFDSAECAQVYWYQMILSGIENALRQTPPASPPDTDPEAVKARILEALQRAECTLTGTEEGDGGTRVDIATGDRAGHALYRNGNLLRLNLREAEPEIVYDDDQPRHVRRMIRE